MNDELSARVPKKKRKKFLPDDPLSVSMREGYWRMLQRIAYGIPGLVGSGEVQENGTQFTGGLAGIRTAWLLKPHQIRMFEAVPIAAMYTFGMAWTQVFRMVGLTSDKKGRRMEDVIRDLEEEFGPNSERELRKGTIKV